MYQLNRMDRLMTFNYLSKENINKRNTIKQMKWDNFNKLNPEERDAILKLYNVVEDALFTIQDCNNLWLSDLKELESAHWHIKNLWAIGSELESLEDTDG